MREAKRYLHRVSATICSVPPYVVQSIAHLLVNLFGMCSYASTAFITGLKTYILAGTSEL
jgi:hypothetical protein